MYCYVVILRANKRDRELRRHCARHSSPLTFTSSTPDNGQILIQLGRINQITMTPCFLCLSRFVSSQLLAVRISIEHTSSWNNRRRSSRGGEWFQPVKGPQVNTSNPISALSAARSTEFRARHCGFLIPFALKHTNGDTGRTRPTLKRVLLQLSLRLDHVSLIILSHSVAEFRSTRLIPLTIYHVIGS